MARPCSNLPIFDRQARAGLELYPNVNSSTACRTLGGWDLLPTIHTYALECADPSKLTLNGVTSSFAELNCGSVGFRLRRVSCVACGRS